MRKKKRHRPQTTDDATTIQAHADAWQAKVNTHFEYLQATYGFRITQVDASSLWNTRLVYQTAEVGVYVDCNYEFIGVEVSLVRLLNGTLPRYPIFITPDTRLYQFMLDDLLKIRAPQLVPELWAIKGLKAEQIEASLKFLARAMNDHATDILSGDLSIFATLEEMVKQRAFERPQTIVTYSRGKPPRVIKVWPPEENPPEWLTQFTLGNGEAEEA